MWSRNSELTAKNTPLISQSSQHSFFWMWLLTSKRRSWTYLQNKNFFFSWLYCPSGPRPLLLSSAVTLRYTTLCRTSLDEWWVRHRDFYLTTHNTHKRKTSMLPSEFEPAISGNERPQTHAFNRTVTSIDPKAEIIIVKWPVHEGILIYSRCCVCCKR